MEGLETLIRKNNQPDCGIPADAIVLGEYPPTTCNQ
jgi:hypothetical protein